MGTVGWPETATSRLRLCCGILTTSRDCNETFNMGLVRDNTSRVGFLCSVLATAFVLTLVASFVQRAEAADHELRIEVYYLSPDVWKRAAISADRLRQDSYHVEGRGFTDSLKDRTAEVFELVHSVGRPTSKGGRLRYDYRLCLSSGPDAIWINRRFTDAFRMASSEDYKPYSAEAFSNGETFELTEEERLNIVELFHELDALAGGPRRDYSSWLAQ